MNDKVPENGFLTSLGLARKAGKLILGWDRISERDGGFPLLIVSSDAAERTKKNAKQKSPLSLIEVKETMSELGAAVGIGSAALIAVTDSGFAKLLKGKAGK